MIHIDRKHLDEKCTEIISDIEDKKVRSSAWLWIIAGGIAGFALSCIRFHNKPVEPFLAGEIKEKEITSGKFDSKPKNRFKQDKK